MEKIIVLRFFFLLKNCGYLFVLNLIEMSYAYFGKNLLFFLFYFYFYFFALMVLLVYQFT